MRSLNGLFGIAALLLLCTIAFGDFCKLSETGGLLMAWCTMLFWHIIWLYMTMSKMPLLPRFIAIVPVSVLTSTGLAYLGQFIEAHLTSYVPLLIASQIAMFADVIYCSITIYHSLPQSLFSRHRRLSGTPAAPTLAITDTAEKHAEN